MMMMMSGEMENLLKISLVIIMNAQTHSTILFLKCAVYVKVIWDVAALYRIWGDHAYLLMQRLMYFAIKCLLVIILFYYFSKVYQDYTAKSINLICKNY